MDERAGGVYRHRNPKESPLYCLVEDYFDRFEGLYDERFAPTHGHWRPVVHQVADAFLDCGDLRHGFARIRCENPDCRHEMLLAFSCRGRYFYPSCHAKRVALFVSRLESEILAPVPHRQYVFTIPKLLRLRFRFDCRLLGLLSACAYQSILEMMRAVVCEPGAVPGMVAAIQTYGDQGTNWHPMSMPSSAMAFSCPAVHSAPCPRPITGNSCCSSVIS
jgi:Transposase zinc-binding domain